MIEPLFVLSFAAKRSIEWQRIKKEHIYMLTERVCYKALQDKITDPARAARHIRDCTNLFISEFLDQ